MYALVLIIVLGVQTNAMEAGTTNWSVSARLVLREDLNLVDCYKELNDVDTHTYNHDNKIVGEIYSYWPGSISSHERREWDTILICEAK